MLGIIVWTIFIAVMVNLLLKKFNLPTIIGYIATGTIIAYLFDLHNAVNNHDLKEIAEFGIVFLMFTIGLEFSIDHLNKMKKEVLVTGGLQIVVTTVFVFLVCMYILGFDYKTSLVIGAALSLSSTAIVLKIYNENGDIKKPYGRRVLGILIMQDIGVIPILLMISIFSMDDSKSIANIVFETTVAAFILILLLYITGKYLLEPFFEYVSESKSEELFVASVLLIAIGASYMAHYFGFSHSLGAFIAGMMISETKFKHQVEADLVPFRNLLLGVFFITVGMQINFSVIAEHIFTILILLPVLLGLKYIIIYLLVRIDDTKRVAFKTALSLVQIGEFSLAVLELARSKSLIDPTYSQILIVTIVISMLLTPLVLKNLSSIAARILPEDTMQIVNSMQIADDTKGHIVVIGYGHLGQEVVEKLKAEHRNYVIVEHNMKYYKIGKDKNEPIIFGNAASKTILQSINIKESAAIVVAIDNPEKLTLICEVIDDLTHNTKTIVKVGRKSEAKELEKLHIEHVIVEDEVLSQAILEETRSCRLDFIKK
ncbi:cation:proton antiporter [Malaciobacter marinus]|uniref:Glutathione-regulated potassium-efflux system protein, KefB/KefC family n=1 Tax=Malaciobacter marinus TaxID=505249 RepID=A0A347TI69_9BACT|nr:MULTISPECIES: cation:proton antiporter [Malaciobacter]AXX86297.1 glutathione-regulated potassium-efflux system protein, KefB/KefC family [Malaciobacter marinus]PHO15686.1 sodium:proton exchanger [Malaciobacter marinus]RYA23521.1 sodium:proton exchanger [Malaciobacter halophilus]